MVCGGPGQYHSNHNERIDISTDYFPRAHSTSCGGKRPGRDASRPAARPLERDRRGRGHHDRVGHFPIAGGIANRLPGPLPMIGVWVIGGVFALCGALTLAEVAGALPETGGLYVFIREGWGRLPAFLFGWAELSVIRAAALGAVSTTCAEYGFRLFGLDPSAPGNVWPVHYVAAACIGIVALFNCRGLRWGAVLRT